MTDASLGEEPEEIKDDEVIDPVILVLATKDKEPLGHRLTSVIDSEGPMASRAETPRLTTPLCQNWFFKGNSI